MSAMTDLPAATSGRLMNRPGHVRQATISSRRSSLSSGFIDDSWGTRGRMTKLCAPDTAAVVRLARQDPVEHEDLRRSLGAEATAHHGADVLSSRGAIARDLDTPAEDRT